ncbi:MAG: hypothetical protein NTZ97_01795 [Candidatus Moranbacteria bacterium]|nr:hypothetical protein [Candidatus Moranbacteria bacterium]
MSEEELRVSAEQLVLGEKHSSAIIAHGPAMYEDTVQYIIGLEKEYKLEE